MTCSPVRCGGVVLVGFNILQKECDKREIDGERRTEMTRTVNESPEGIPQAGSFQETPESIYLTSSLCANAYVGCHHNLHNPVSLLDEYASSAGRRTMR